MAPTTGYTAGVAANDVLLAYAPEAVWGTKPATAFQQIRVQSESFALSKTRSRPSEILSTGQVSNAVTTKVDGKGDIKFALSTATPLDLLGASIMGVPDTAISFANKTTVAATASGFTDSGSGFVTGNIHAGDWIRVVGFSTASINGYYQVLTVVAGTITTLPAPATTAAAGQSITITGTKVLNGTTVNSFWMQKQLASNLFLSYPGSIPTGGSISASLGGFWSGNIDFLCKDQQKGTTDGSTGAQLAAGSGNVMDVINGFGTLYRGAAAISATVTKVDLKWQQQSARLQYGMGSYAAQGFGKGLLEVSGSMEVYFKDFTLFDEFVSETASMLAVRAVDLTGAGYIFTVANGTIMNPQITAGGPNTDVMATFQIEGNPSSGSSIFGGSCFQIDKV